ncbi:MAG TPA: nitronate monooxygenase family protein [Cerasibacillus sp.]|uniref:NAD(P)H-dependent flavin oxidoreductase n=1 Tax=Cerasibacillus sp. TaxID=2498711 RepID=UPI002F42B620
MMRRSFLNQLQINYPIIQAGMAGGITTPELVSEVSRVGALGTVGAGYMSPATLKKTIHDTKLLTSRPFAVNVFAINLSVNEKNIRQPQQFLNQFRDELGLEHGSEIVKAPDYLEENIQVIIEEKIPIVSTAFGILPTQLIKRLKAENIFLIGMATNVEEAEKLVEAGYDAIVAQGTEAGGHRGTFDVETYPMGCQIGLLPLVEQCLAEFSVPIIAAGGIYSRNQVKSLLAMGVSAVQIGTRFLLAKEAGTNDSYRQALLQAKAEDTVITNVFSGRPARAIQNRMTKEAEKNTTIIQSFPIQNALTQDIRSKAKQNENKDYQSLWAGQGVGGLTKEETAVSIIEDLIE